MVGRAPGSFRQRAGICAAISLTAGMLLGNLTPAVAQGVNLICDPEAAGAVRDSVAEGIAEPDVSFVVGYSLMGAGPVICINDGEVGITGPWTEVDSIPEDTGPVAAESLDILAIEEAFFVRYQLNGESGRIEKRFCHSVGVEEHLDCFIIFSVVSPDVPPDIPPDLFGPVRVFISEDLAVEIATQLGLDDASRVPGFVQSPVGIASQVCPEGAPQLSRDIRESGTAECTAVTVDSEAFINLVEQQLLPEP